MLPVYMLPTLLGGKHAMTCRFYLVKYHIHTVILLLYFYVSYVLCFTEYVNTSELKSTCILMYK